MSFVRDRSKAKEDGNTSDAFTSSSLRSSQSTSTAQQGFPRSIHPQSSTVIIKGISRGDSSDTCLSSNKSKTPPSSDIEDPSGTSGDISSGVSSMNANSVNTDTIPKHGSIFVGTPASKGHRNNTSFKHKASVQGYLDQYVV